MKTDDQIKIISIDSRLLKSVLSKEAQGVVFNPLYNTVEMFNELDENNNLIRKVYKVEYLMTSYVGAPTKKDIENFCRIINILVEGGDIFYGSLLIPSIMNLEKEAESGEDHCIIYYALSKLSGVELNKKYKHLFK